MSDQQAHMSTSNAEGPARKRPRKRSRKNKPTYTGVGEAGATEAAASLVESPSQPSTSQTRLTNEAHDKPVAKAAPSASLSQINPHKPSYVTRPAVGGRSYTLSVAIPGSIVLNAQSPELQSRLAGHVARTCAIFNVDEIVIFEEGDVYQEEPVSQSLRGLGGRHAAGPKRQHHAEQANGVEEENQEGEARSFDPHTFLARVLQYLETPQYLRKSLFPMHRDLRLAGLMPPLDCPHHLRFEDISDYREGVTVETPHWVNRNKHHSSAQSVYVNVGLRDPIDAELPDAASSLDVGTRVTVRMPSVDVYGAKGRLVSPREPVENSGLYWGYSVRLAPSLSSLLTTCPYSSEDGYDLVMGTSERGCSLSDLINTTLSGTPMVTPEGETIEPLPTSFKHAIIVFGGLSGLEMAVEADQGIKLDRHTARNLFDAWINVVENQGSRTVRTEEAIMIALARLKAPLEMLGHRSL